jgi:hypothetical protein
MWEIFYFNRVSFINDDVVMAEHGTSEKGKRRCRRADSTNKKKI